MNLKQIMASDNAILINADDLAETFTYRKYSDNSEYQVVAVITNTSIKQPNDGRGLPTSYTDNAIASLVLPFKPQTYDELIASDGEAWRVGSGMVKISSRWRLEIFKKEQPSGFSTKPRY
jgi:hypothetical protein